MIKPIVLKSQSMVRSLKLVRNYVLSLLLDPERFESVWRKAQQAERDNLAPKGERLGVVRDLIQHCEQEAEETAAALKRQRG